MIHDVGRKVYALPGGHDGAAPCSMKLGEHTAGPVADPEARRGAADAGRRRWMADYVRRFWPGLEPEPVAAYDCLYTRTESGDFVIDRRGLLVVCSACSGHAAKFTPMVGEWLADLVEGRFLPLQRFSLPASSC